MSVFDINGQIEVNVDLTHEEFVKLLFKALKKEGLHFKGVSSEQVKVITEDTYKALEVV
ncbi:MULTISPECIES: hypothetical protein [Bacillus]|uniref:hypothetical protein n=1 Tax=Bacillus TaxID=1386 RepID=UPI00209D939D|nr:MULTISPECIES: hypothetical protein [Bacillus]MCP1159355.1 hypothetical protein [Bacillus infantis]MDT0160374.1 hypothetical protein [Bacillus sp. AG4(2022)]